MKKRVIVNRKNIKNIVNHKLNKGGDFVNESKIDKAIKEYLVERFDNKFTESDNNSFSPKVKSAFTDMSKALNNMIEDLKIIQIKEPDVIVDTTEEGDLYSEQVLDDMITDLEGILESLYYLTILRK